MHVSVFVESLVKLKNLLTFSIKFHIYARFFILLLSKSSEKTI